MVRKLALAVALALGGASMTAQGLGLGDIKARSALNQNFDADIALLSVERDELDAIKVKLAPNEVFERAGVERSFLLSQLRFEPEVSADGRTVIRVTSDFPIREPFLNFLVEVNWPFGRLVKEYTVLLDPPTTTSRSAPRIATPAVAPRRAVPAAVERQPVSTGSAPVSRQITQYGPVKPNETLWAIARDVRPAGVSMAQMMMALLDANPQAFLDNNINKLRRGQILRVPSRDEILGLSRAEAQARYRQQQDAWLAEREQIEQQEVAEAETAATSTPAEPEAELRIASAGPAAKGEEAGAVEGSGAREPALEDLNSQVLLAREEAESSRQEAEILRERVEALRAQLEDMQRLLTLKDDQLARLQGSVAEPVPSESGSVEAEAEASAPTPIVEEPTETRMPEVAGEAETPPEAGVTEVAEIPEVGTAAPEHTVAEPLPEAGVTEVPETPEIAAATPEDTVAEALAEFGYVDQTPLSVVPEDGFVEEPVGEPEIVPDPVVAVEPEIVLEPEASAPAEAKAPVATPQPPVTAEPVGPETISPAITAEEAETGFVPSLPVLVGGLAGVVVLGGLLGLVAARRGSKREPELGLAAAGAAAAPVPAVRKATEAEVGDSADLSELASVDLDAAPDEVEDVDPISEADVYIAYGRYQQAEQLLRQAMEKNPERLAIPHKLLEVYYATRNASAFVSLAGEMMADGRDQADPKAWERVKEMGRELDANNAMFTAVAGGATTGVAAAAAQAVKEEDALGLDDLDLSELARDLEDDLDEGRAVAAIEDPEPLSVDLEEAISQLEADVGEDRSAALDELESLDLDMPTIEVTKPEEKEQEIISLDELDVASSIGQEVEESTAGRASEDEGLGADSVLTIDTDLEPTELQAELEQLSELSGLSDELAAAEATAESSGGGLDIDQAFAEEVRDDEPETIDLYDGEATSAIGEDEVQTKLDLARAYVEMGDSEGARSILEEVQEEGSDEQRQEAGQILQRLAS